CISQQFSNLFNGYTQAYNNKYNRKGSLFTPNFKRKLITSEVYFARLVVYIHNNPVYHGFVNSPADWLYSSYLAYMLNKSTNVEIKDGLDWFGGIIAFRDLHKELNQEKLHQYFGSRL
ncbi:MAG: transposase, partial [Candidatus Halalkalibacterium sp. M3_1C_030]